MPSLMCNLCPREFLLPICQEHTRMLASLRLATGAGSAAATKRQLTGARSCAGYPLKCGLFFIRVGVRALLAAQLGFDEGVELAVHDGLYVAGLFASAEVLHHLVRLENVGANLAAETDLALFSVVLFHLGALLVELEFVEAGLEHIHRGGAVLDLRALVLAGDDEAARDVGDAHGGVGGVDALAARTAGAVDVDADVLFL